MQITLTDGWRFALGEFEPAWQKNFDDSSFAEVTVPHDWSVTLPFSRQNSSGTGYVPGGIGWYRCHFALPSGAEGMQYTLCFDGVYKHAKVWFNGYYLGSHANGWTPFSFDVTPFVRGGGADNVISVRVDHRDIADCRWFTGSGINRAVTLLARPAVSVPLHGVFFRTLSTAKEAAQICVETTVENNSDADFSGMVYQFFSPFGIAGAQAPDRELSPVLTLSAEIELKPGEAKTVCQDAELKDPLLWSPAQPNLYCLQTLLVPDDTDSPEADHPLPYESSGCGTAAPATGAASSPDTDADPAKAAAPARPVLVNEELVGVRSFRFDPDHGFSLNGEPMKLKGVCLHDDCGVLGSAAEKEVWYRRLVKLKKAGCNAIRMSHNPHMSELYDLCDELGFLVMDEAFDEWEAPKNKWSTGHNVYPPRHQGYYEDFPANHEADMRAMVLRGRNHPCIILWSIGNEIDYPNDPYCHPLFETMTGNNDNNKPAAERMYNPDKPNAERLAVLASMLSGKLRAMDDSRPITLAAAFPELSAQLGFLDSLDVAGYNYKEHLYEESHKRFPDLPFLGSENSHSVAAWKAVTDNEYISGQFLWTGIDYLGEAHGWPVRAAASGILTLAGFEKFGFFRRMSFWSCEPVAHLACARKGDGPEWRRPFNETWNFAPGEEVEIRCYTNQPVAELFLNEKPLGSRTKEEGDDSIRWIVPFEPGTLQVYAYDSLTDPSCPAAWDRLETVYAPSLLKAEVYPVPEAFWQTDNPIRQVEVTTEDCEGRTVTTGSVRLMVTVEGGRLLGLESGDVADTTEYSSGIRSTYRGHMIIYVRRDNPDEPARVKILSEDLGTKELLV